MIEATGTWISELPFVALWLLFFLGAMARGNAMYALGRGITEGGRKSRFRRRFTGLRMDRAKEFVDRYGAIAVALSYLTVGFQSMVQVATGMARMSLWRFEPGALVGSIAWATIYTTIGFAVWQTWLGLVARSPWAFMAAIALTGLIAYGIHRRRARKRHVAGGAVPAVSEDRTPPGVN